MHDQLQTKRGALQICMRLVDHAAVGRRYVEEGLRLIKKGDVTRALEAFFHAATLPTACATRQSNYGLKYG